MKKNDNHTKLLFLLQIEYKMSVAELKNNLHRMVVETNDPDILAQISALFASLLGEEDWWVSLSTEEKQSIELGMADAEAGRTVSFNKIRDKVKKVLGKH
jgi:predicted transcriptional regulator